MIFIDTSNEFYKNRYSSNANRSSSLADSKQRHNSLPSKVGYYAFFGGGFVYTKGKLKTKLLY